MGTQPYPEGLLRVAVAFAVALVLTPVVRTLTIELDSSVGRAWPFSMRHCLTRDTPGCAGTGAVRTASVIPSSPLRASR